MIQFQRIENIGVIDEFKNLSLIKELKAKKMVCVSTRQIDCSCHIAVLKKNEICELFNKTAQLYMTNKIEEDSEFIYVKKK